MTKASLTAVIAAAFDVLASGGCFGYVSISDALQ
jgi:hypothetical protein